MFRGHMSVHTASDTPEDPLATQAALLAQRIESALPVMFARWLSLHDARGASCWQSGSVLGPAERDGVRAALEAFGGDAAPARVNCALQSERTAVLLRSTDVFGDFTGFVMMVVDNKRLKGKGVSAKDMPVPVLKAVRDWGAALAMPLPEDDTAMLAMLAPPASEDADDASGELQLGIEVPDAAAAHLQTLPLLLYAQRLVPIQSGTRIRRYETLVRLPSVESWNAAPDVLLREAEQRSLGHVIDGRVVAELVTWLRARKEVWRTEPAQFSVNLSATTLHDPHFPGFVTSSLQQAGLPQGIIAFEIDQSLCRRHPQRSHDLAVLFERAGAGIVIDDFSLHEDSVSLLMLPGLRLIKIDRDLTGTVLHSKSGQACMAAIVSMARVAGVHSVAKKIDREEEHALLGALGVDFVQGYGAAPPAPLDAIDSDRAQSLTIDPLAGPERPPSR
jgi:EAL domain-containing protein (putative c-di-GMP-specific phosphodiesterase class I)